MRDDDIRTFAIYFASSENEELTLIETVDASDDFFEHILQSNVSGCYAISAIDRIGNESPLSDPICIDNCPLYELPNTFTPNQDLANDMFVPRESRFINRVEFEVYNRWGQKVYETEDPALNWDGFNQNGKELSEGTYFYTCIVYESRLNGEESSEILKGTIQLVR